VIVFNKKKAFIEINTVDELEHFILLNNIKKHFNHFNKKYCNDIKILIENTPKINLKVLKTEFIKPFFKNDTPSKIDYWLNRGYSYDDAMLKLSRHQTENGKKFLNFLKDESKRYSYLDTQIGYWIKKGYTIEMAKKKIHERQNTFSIEKCIQRYGNKKGLEIWKIRQKKWRKSLVSNTNFDAIEKNRILKSNLFPKTLNGLIDKFGELEGKIKFAKRYWQKDIASIIEFDNYQNFLRRERTILFYDKDFRFKILSEQNFKCGNIKCGCKNTEKKFHLHHIDYDKKNDNRENLIFLCHSCHSKTVNVRDRNLIIEYYSHINKNIIEGNSYD